MNYLAHLFLSQRDSQSMVGNLMGDFRKYISNKDLPVNVLKGIENHRQIDSITDSNVRVRKLKTLFSPERRRFGGIILDVLFDYFLIKHWSRYTQEDILAFIQYSYQALEDEWDLMPEAMQHVMERVIEQDWLASYSTLQGVEYALNGISRRMRFKNRLAYPRQEIENNYEPFEQGFLELFPVLIEHAAAGNLGKMSRYNFTKSPGLGCSFNLAS